MYPAITDVITLNVGGVRHQVLWKTLQSISGPRLGKLPSPNVEKQLTNPSPQNKDVYFDRNPIIFNSILDFYQTGKLNFNDDICLNIISGELQFWMISEGNISPFCQKKFVREKLNTAKEVENESKLKENQHLRTSRIWNILENPSSSILQGVW